MKKMRKRESRGREKGKAKGEEELVRSGVEVPVAGTCPLEDGTIGSVGVEK